MSTPLEVATVARNIAGRYDGTKIKLTLHDRREVTGRVEAVSPANAWVKVAGTRIPCEAIDRAEEA